MDCGCTDAELIKAAAGKDKDAFRILMQKYQGRIYRVAYRYTGDSEAAKELTQDIFFKVYRAAPSYSPDARFFTWLYRIAANHCINYVRKRSRDPLHMKDRYGDGATSAESAGNQQDELESRERASRVRAALDRLPERQKAALVLLRFEGLSYREIAGVLGCSVPAVESLVHRGMQALKKKLSRVL